MKVFVLTMFDGETYSIFGIFSTQMLAISAGKCAERSGKYNLDYCSFEITAWSLDCVSASLM